MSKRTISIDQKKCIGCGQCTSACHEGAIELINGKATLTAADACDGLGACLPACPVGAITFLSENSRADIKPSLLNWPLQIKLVPVTAPYFDNAELLIAADCTAFANTDFYNNFAKGKVVIIGCPKLDDGDYSQKLTEIFESNNINSITIARMEVPCCFGLQSAVEQAVANSGKSITPKVKIIEINGNVSNTL